jgi:ribonuclease BN (tRNA processing enzyme)
VAVSREVAGEPPLVLDLGTGVRQLGEEMKAAFDHRAPLGISAFITHLHFDHIQGLPFFIPTLWMDTVIDIYGPAQQGETLEERFTALIRPPYFPVPIEELPAQLRFHELTDAETAVGELRVTSRLIPHVGETCGFRVEADGVSIAYISDHQAPKEFDKESSGMRAGDTIAQSVLDLARDVNLLIHDAQYTDEEFRLKAHWGHSTVGYATRVAATAGARSLALYHHDPTHGDDQLDAMGEQAAAAAADAGLESIVVASEGLSIVVGDRARESLP